MRKNKTTQFMTVIYMLFFTIVFLIIAGRFFYIQATGEVDNVSLKDWAKEKRITSYSLASERGKIYDRNGMTIAYDLPTYRIYAVLQEEYSENASKPRHVDNPE